jgi:hypothetical protein
MKKTDVFIGFALATIALNSDRAIVLAATTGNPFSNPMTEDIFSDPASDSMTGEVTQLLESSSPSIESNSLEESSLNIALNSTETTSNSTDALNTTEATSNSTDAFNSTEAAFNSTDSLNLTEVSSNSATTFDLSNGANAINGFIPTETSYLTDAVNPTANFNSTEASTSISSDLEPVPEPLTIFGTGLALGFGLLLNREHSKKQQSNKAQK